jgi:hypothetical protein
MLYAGILCLRPGDIAIYHCLRLGRADFALTDSAKT